MPSANKGAASARDIALARIRSCLTSDIRAIREIRPCCDIDGGEFRWEIENATHHRITFPPLLAKVELDTLSAPDSCLAFRCRVPASGRVTRDSVRAERCPPSGPREFVDKFLEMRRAVFDAIRNYDGGTRRIIAACHLRRKLGNLIRDYARAYRELLAQMETPEARWNLLRMDAIYLELSKGHDEHKDSPLPGRDNAVILLPTHPVRLLWLAAYHELLAIWEQDLLGRRVSQRRHVLDPTGLEDITGDGFPFLTWWDHVYMFAGALDFLWPVYLPPEEPDPAGTLHRVREAIGATTSTSHPEARLPQLLADRLRRYVESRPGCQALRLNVVHPGAGRLLTDTLAHFLELREKAPVQAPESAIVAPRIEIMVQHIHRFSTVETTLRSLQEAVYRELEAPPSCSHLAPFFSYALLPGTNRGGIPPTPVHISFIFDRSNPSIECVDLPDEPTEEESATFHGLMLRLVRNLETSEDGAIWRHKLVLKARPGVSPHPVAPEYTEYLWTLQRLYSATVLGAPYDPDKDFAITLTERLRTDDLMNLDKLHVSSDWVITVDRCLGPELYDDPSGVHSACFFERYLLDHVPTVAPGTGHEVVVTTCHREEVVRMLAWACRELNMEGQEVTLLRSLKQLSARFAISGLIDQTRAREVAALATTLLYLEEEGELDNCVLVPIDFHPEVFLAPRLMTRGNETAQRCDFLRARASDDGLEFTLYEVKWSGDHCNTGPRTATAEAQLRETEMALKRMLLPTSADGGNRLDITLNRARFATLLRQYAARAYRYRLLLTESAYDKFLASVREFENGSTAFRLHGKVYIVCPMRSSELARSDISYPVHILDSTIIHRLQSSQPEPDSVTGSDQPCSAAGATTAQPPNQQKGRVPVVPVGSETDGSNAASPRSRQSITSPVAADANACSTKPAQTPRGTIRVHLGIDEENGAPVVWEPSVVGSPHVLIVGISGQGKSVTTTTMILELLRAGVPCFVFDYHGDYSRPKSPLQQVSNVHVLRPDPLPFSPLEPVGDLSAQGWQTECVAIREIVEYVCGLGEIQAHQFQEALEAAFERHTRNGLLHGIPSLSEVRTILETGLRNKKVYYRTSVLFKYGIFSDTPNATRGAFADLLKRPVVLDLSATKEDTFKRIAAAFTLRRIYKEAALWGHTDRIRLAIVLDEAHHLAKDRTLPKIMKEHRKYGVAVIVASQSLADFHQAAIENAGSKIVFKLNYPDARKVSRFLQSRSGHDLVREIQSLPVGHALVQLQTDEYVRRVKMAKLDQ